MEILISIFKETLLITVFVMVMMLLIEYFTVLSRGKLTNSFRTKGWLQILFASFMGITPGCLGTYVVVSMYTHRLIGFAGLVTATIATSGDEIFVLFSLMPDKAIMLVMILAAIGIASGFLLKLIMRNRTFSTLDHLQTHVHTDEVDCVVYQPTMWFSQIKNISFHRALLVGSAIIFTFLIMTGDIGHDHSIFNVKVPTETSDVHALETEADHDQEADHAHEAEHSEGHSDEHGLDWETVTFLIVSFIGMFVVATVPDHFLVNHLWGHVIKKHFMKIFLWTFGAILVIHFINNFLHIEDWVQQNYFYVLLIAVLIGIIPESGPHIIFVTLYASGTIPFYILLANSIVQDGHGAIPLLAESRKSFVLMKLVNVCIGLIAGLVGMWFF